MYSYSLVLLTKNTSSIPVLGPIWNLIVEFLGWIMNVIYIGLEKMGIGNIGLAIIIFTLVTRIIIFPTTLKQQKSSRMMQLMQPEMKAIQDKYKNKTDNASMMAMNAEMKALNEKYGTSMTAGCLPLLIQMPIIFALYRIIMNIPAYVPSVYSVFSKVVDAIGGSSGAQSLYDFATEHDMTKILSQVSNLGINDPSKFDAAAVKNLMIDFLYKLNPSQWSLLPDAYPTAATVINTAAEEANHFNNFLGINLSTAPSAMGWTPNVYWIIPILAGLSQWLSSELTMRQNKAMADNDQSQQMMKSMNIMMPIMSVWFCFTFASGIGLYWVASAVFMIIQQLILNTYFSMQSDEEILRKSMEKANAKRKKKGLPPIDEKSVTKKIQAEQAKLSNEEESRLNVIAKQSLKTKEATDYYNKNAKPGSLASKANMVQLFNEKHDKK